MGMAARRFDHLPPQLVLDDCPTLCAWAAAHIPHMGGEAFPASATAMGIAIEGKLSAVLVFSDWRPRWRTMQISAAAIDPRWFTARAAIDWCLEYAFGACDVEKLWAATASDNPRTIKLLLGWGFEQEAVLQRHYGAKDAVLTRLFREKYRARKRGART